MSVLAPLHLPALRCRMGDWIYYVTCLSFNDVAERISLASEVYTSESLNDLIQRALTGRASSIGYYLKTQPQHFFNSIIVGVWGGQPEWLDIRITSSEFLELENFSQDETTNISETIGVLRLSGQEKLFAIDGQHRVAAIREVLDSDSDMFTPHLSVDEVSIIFVGHDKSREGTQRTRRLFSTLNRYAKPVSKGEIISLDEDDAFAITTRQLAEDHPLLRGRRASPSKQTRIVRADKSSFTTLLTVYDIAEVLTLNRHPNWNKRFLTNIKPPDDVINEIHTVCDIFWTAMMDEFPAVAEVAATSIESNVAGKYRTITGGHLLFRPIGQMAFARAIRLLEDTGVKTASAVKTLSTLDFELSSKLWSKLLWNSVSNTMITNPKSRDVAAELMLYMKGYQTESGLLGRYQAAVGDETATLPDRAVLGRAKRSVR